MFTAAVLETGWCMKDECDNVSGFVFAAQRLQMRVCLCPQCRKEIVVADDMLLCCCLLQPARAKREVTVD